MGQALTDTQKLHNAIDNLTPFQQAEVMDFISKLGNKLPGYRAINDETEEERVAAIRKALTALQKSGVAEKFGDPLEWQREIRKDRPLPGRD